MNQSRQFLQKLFTKYLLFTNTAVSGSLMALGDCVTQKIERKNKEPTQHDWKRSGRMFCMGTFLGPIGHGWYTFLDRFVLGAQGAKMALKKILCDQAVAGPFFCSFFFFGMNLLEGKTAADGVREVKEKFLTVYLIDWCVWPPAQFINFYFLPTSLRVVYVSFITLCWNTFLSWMKHKSHSVEVHESEAKGAVR